MTTLPPTTSDRLSAELRATVEGLIDICRDGQYGYELSAHGTAKGDTILRAELLQYSGQRQEFIVELNDALRKLGEQPSLSSCTVTGAQGHAWINLKQAIASNDRAAILAECEQGDAVAVEAYRTAAFAGLPPELNGLVHAQLDALSRVHDRIVSLKRVAEDA